MIRISAPAMLGNEKRYVLECLDANWISHGRFVESFEKAFARFCDTDDAVMCSSGTAALHLLLKAHGVGPGDAVFVPALTYVATANAVEYCGARPFFCDSLDATWCLDPRSVRKAVLQARGVGLNPKAIIAVHLYGVVAAMDELQAVADEFGMLLLEDAAQAHGATHHGQRTGSLGQGAAFSFYANKIIACGEGGAVTTNDAGLAARMRLYRGQGQAEQRFRHMVVGFNYRMTDLCAAVGLAQLEQFEAHRRVRSDLASMYKALLSVDSRFTLQQETAGDVRADWLPAVVLPPTVNRDAVMQRMSSVHGVETRPFFVSLPALPPYAHCHNPVRAARLSQSGLNLPLHVGLVAADICYIVGALKESLDVAM